MKEFGKLADRCEIVAIADVSGALAEARAKEFGVPNALDNPERLIARDDVDAVVIGVPNKFHADLAILALESGKHVLLEKPMGLNAGHAKRIVRAQQKTGNVLMVSHQMRWEWLTQQVKDQVEKGALGRIYSAKAGWFRRKGIPGWGTWFTRMDMSGGGPLIDIGVHMLDLTMHLMGDPKPVAVTGAVYAEFGPKRKGIGTWGTPNWNGIYDVEDFGTALIRMEDGSTMTLEVSWAVHMDTDSQPFVHLLGSEGGAALRGSKGKFLTESFDRAMEVELNTPSGDEGARVRLSRHFLDCVETGAMPLTSAMTGLTNNLIIDAIYESSRTGREVILDWEGLR
jgi:predicted dehydrogenase